MLALIRGWSDIEALLHNPLMWLFGAFQIWMLVDAIRREEWIWTLFMVISFPTGITALFYYFMVYRMNGPASGGFGLRGFELPGAANRRRVKELQARIHHLDKARDHADLADVYFAQGKMAKAEAEYRLALERDPEDADTRSHFAQCLLRQERAAEALPLLEGVLREDPRHDFGYTLMALAEAQTAVGQKDAAVQSWRKVLETNSYPRARVQYAELLAGSGQTDAARREISEVLEDERHGVSFQKGRDRVWIRRAQKLKSRLG